MAIKFKTKKVLSFRPRGQTLYVDESYAVFSSCNSNNSIQKINLSNFEIEWTIEDGSFHFSKSNFFWVRRGKKISSISFEEGNVIHEITPTESTVSIGYLRDNLVLRTTLSNGYLYSAYDPNGALVWEKFSDQLLICLQNGIFIGNCEYTKNEHSDFQMVKTKER
jgi:outer membrane protein assembly factor BamB